MRASFALAVLLSLAPLAPEALAQSEQGRIGRSEMVVSTSPGYYVYHQPGEATIQVSVEGAVRNPGLYEVAVGTDLSRLLALTGGAAYDAREANQRQRVEVRLFRPQEGVVYATTSADIAANPGAYPALREGDTVIVDVIRKRQFGWQEAGIIAGGLSALALLVNALAGN
jgi:hypothetical protein